MSVLGFAPAKALFLSTGNRIGGEVFKVSTPSSGMAPISVITIPGEAVTGIAFNAVGDFFFTNWDDVEGRIIRLSLDTGRRDVVYAFPGRRIWDVSFR